MTFDKNADKNHSTAKPAAPVADPKPVQASAPDKAVEAPKPTDPKQAQPDATKHDAAKHDAKPAAEPAKK